MMNEVSKGYLNKLNEKLVDALKKAAEAPVYQDSVSEDEESLQKAHYIRFETGGFTKPENKGALRQEVYVYYYSEGRDDLDAIALDIIAKMEDNKHTFVRSDKVGIQKGDTDAYIDELSFTFHRLVKYGC